MEKYGVTLFADDVPKSVDICLTIALVALATSKLQDVLARSSAASR